MFLTLFMSSLSPKSYSLKSKCHTIRRSVCKHCSCHLFLLKVIYCKANAIQSGGMFVNIVHVISPSKYSLQSKCYIIMVSVAKITPSSSPVGLSKPYNQLFTTHQNHPPGIVYFQQKGGQYLFAKLSAG